MKKCLQALGLLLCSSVAFSQVSRISTNTSSATSTGNLGQASTASEDAYTISAYAQLAISNPDYMVTPGDIYSLAFAVNASSTNVISYEILVDSSYKVRIANLAVLDATGKSYLTLKKQAEEIVSKNYPMSGVQFSLISPASFSVRIKGEVKESKEITTWALARLSSIVEGNTTQYSSLRNVRVTSASGRTRTYDLFKANREGDLSQNPYLRPGDTIDIIPCERKVTISGAVKRTGSYELLEGENLKELVEYYAGGLTNMADTSRIELVRINTEENPSGKSIYLTQSDIDSNYTLNDFDKVSIVSKDSFHPIMFMEGAVNNGGGGTSLTAGSKITVQFNTNTNYAYLIRSYSGWFSSSVADIENAYILRQGNAMPINIQSILYDSAATTDLIVEEGDVLRVPFKQFYVQVSGCVYAPGRYPYIPDRTYDYYISLAGGFIKEKNSGESVKITDVNGKELSKTDIITPETTIVANANSFTYYFNQYAPVITTTLTAISTFLSIYLTVTK